MNLVRSGLWVFAGMLLGRMLGLGRELLLAARFGASQTADVAVVILTLPDLVVNLLSGGAMAAVLIPEFVRLKGLERSKAFYQASLIGLLLFAGVALALSLFPGPLISALAPGFDGQTADMTRFLARIAVWAIPAIALAAIAAAYLQAANRFALASLQNITYNLGVLGGLALAVGQHPLRPVAIALLVGGLLRWAVQWPELPRPAFSMSEIWRHSWFNSRIAIRYFQALAAGSLLLLIPVVARRFASFGSEGSVAILNYSFKLIDLPSALGLGVIGTVMFPRFAEHFQVDGGRRSPGIIRKTLWATFGVSLPLAMLLSGTCYWASFRGFAWKDLGPDRIAELLRLTALGFLGMPAFWLLTMSTGVFYAKSNTSAPLRINLAAILGFTGLAQLLSAKFGLPGIMFAYLITHYGMLIGYAILLRGALRE